MFFLKVHVAQAGIPYHAWASSSTQTTRFSPYFFPLGKMGEPARVTELRRYSEGLARGILQEMRIPQVSQLLFEYCSRSRLDPEFLAIGLRSLGCSLITVTGNSIRRFELDGGISNIHEIVWDRQDYSPLICRDMVYYKNWTAGATTLNGQSLNVTGLLDSYAGQTVYNRQRERVSKSISMHINLIKNAQDKVKGYLDYYCIGHDLSQFERDAKETALIFLALKSRSDGPILRNVSRFARHHYIRVMATPGIAGLVMVPVNHGQFSWRLVAMAGTAPPRGDNRRIFGYLDLAQVAQTSPAMRLLLNLFDGAANLIDHYPQCTSNISKEFEGLSAGGNKLLNVDTWTTDFVNRLGPDAQFVIHNGFAPTTIGRIPGGQARRFLKTWVGEMTLVKKPDSDDYFIWFWSLDAGYVRYHSDPEAERRFFQITSAIAHVAENFARQSQDRTHWTKEQLEEFINEYNTHDPANDAEEDKWKCKSAIKAAASQLSDLVSGGQSEESGEDRVAMAILMNRVDELFDQSEDALFANPSNFQSEPANLLFPSNTSYRTGMTQLDIALAIYPQFDTLEIIGKRQVLHAARRGCWILPKIQFLVNAINAGVYEIDRNRSLDWILNDCTRAQVRNAMEPTPANVVANRSRAVCVICNYVFCNAVSEHSNQFRITAWAASADTRSCGKKLHTVGWDCLLLPDLQNDENAVVNENALIGNYPNDSVYTLFIDHLVNLRLAKEVRQSIRPGFVANSVILEYSLREFYTEFFNFTRQISDTNAHASALMNVLKNPTGSIAREDYSLAARFQENWARLTVAKPRIQFLKYRKAPHPGRKDDEIVDSTVYQWIRSHTRNPSGQHPNSLVLMKVLVTAEMVPAQPTSAIATAQTADSQIQWLLGPRNPIHEVEPVLSQPNTSSQPVEMPEDEFDQGPSNEWDDFPLEHVPTPGVQGVDMPNPFDIQEGTD